MKTILIENKNTKFISHRGLSCTEIENTLKAFEEASKLNYYGVETDIQVTKDSKFVTFHDDKTNRLSNVNINIGKSTYDEIKNIKLKDNKGIIDNFSSIPLLEEYLAICKHYSKIAVIEIKNAMNNNDINNLINIVKKHYFLDNTIFISFIYENLLYIRKLLPNINLQLITKSRINRKLIKKIKLAKIDLNVFEKRIKKRKIKLLHKNNIKINCWTCDDKKRALKLINWNIDFITTNILEEKKNY